MVQGFLRTECVVFNFQCSNSSVKNVTCTFDFMTSGRVNGWDDSSQGSRSQMRNRKKKQSGNGSVEGSWRTVRVDWKYLDCNCYRVAKFRGLKLINRESRKGAAEASTVNKDNSDKEKSSERRFCLFLASYRKLICDAVCYASVSAGPTPTARTLFITVEDPWWLLKLLLKEETIKECLKISQQM